MKILRLSEAYPAYISYFVEAHPDLEGPYSKRKAAFDYDSFSWADFYVSPLAKFGYEVQEVTLNADFLQKIWAQENGVPFTADGWESEIAIAQTKAFQPDILWFDSHDANLLKAIKTECGPFRLVVGWSGSAIAKTDAWKEIDLILSCAPETVAELSRMGHQARHLDHAFEPRVLERIGRRESLEDVSFVGQIVLNNQFHLKREKIIRELASRLNMSIYSSAKDSQSKSQFRAKQAAYLGVSLLRKLGTPETALSRLPILKRAASWEGPPQAVDKILQKQMKPAAFGLEMYRILASSRLTLNVHADSSPTHASNMRMFEGTGVGTCLLTDRKQEMSLFQDGEVVTYDSAEDCAEKARWLLDHPKEREEIARRGQQRTLKDHTFAVRSEKLHEILKGFLRG
ncbi:glycosyltransferase [bacterium]|nr:glycosyltransferase [bacterium]